MLVPNLTDIILHSFPESEFTNLETSGTNLDPSLGGDQPQSGYKH